MYYISSISDCNSHIQKGLWAQEQRHKSAIVIQKGLWEQEQIKVQYKGQPLSDPKQTIVLNSYFSENCLFTKSKVAPVMRLKSKECILENQTV